MVLNPKILFQEVILFLFLDKIRAKRRTIKNFNINTFQKGFRRRNGRRKNGVTIKTSLNLSRIHNFEKSRDFGKKSKQKESHENSYFQEVEDESNSNDDKME